jgi:Na+/H+ antiporter NhaA
VAAHPFSGRTAWARNLQTPLRVFLRTEAGSAAVLLGSAVAALAWVNISASSYEAVWGARLSVLLAGTGVSLDLREWVNSGLMTFPFFVFGLEARREFDMGELRERARLALPVAAGLGGLIIPVVIYLAFNAGGPAAHGWGAAMSTDSAFALGTLAVTGPRFPDRVRAFLLSVAVVDDLVSLVVIGAAYSKAVVLGPLGIAAGIFAVILLLRRARIRTGVIYAAAGTAAWTAVLKSGVDPVVVGLVMGLLTFAYPAARTDLERASDLFRYASDLGLDRERFGEHLRKRAGAARIAEDVDTADLSGVTGTPTFFINGRRHYGSYDITALTSAVLAAKAAAAPAHDPR